MIIGSAIRRIIFVLFTGPANLRLFFWQLVPLQGRVLPARFLWRRL